MGFLAMIFKIIFGALLDKGVELADREDIVEDAYSELESLDPGDSDLDGFDRFDGLFDEAGSRLS